MLTHSGLASICLRSPWVPGARAFLYNAAYPRATVYEYKEGEPVGLSQTGQKLWRAVMSEITTPNSSVYLAFTFYSRFCAVMCRMGYLFRS